MLDASVTFDMVSDDALQHHTAPQVIHGNLSPVWESLFEFPISDSSATLSIYVWSQSSRFMRDRCDPNISILFVKHRQFMII
jgi:hypothetical protein